jgi:CspA family cold shock protein
MATLPSERHRRSPHAVPGARIVGRVRWFDQNLGIGQVRVKGRGFARVHYKDIVDIGYRALDAGDTVSFWVEETAVGPVLRDVVHESSLPRE